MIAIQGRHPPPAAGAYGGGRAAFTAHGLYLGLPVSSRIDCLRPTQIPPCRHRVGIPRPSIFSANHGFRFAAVGYLLGLLQIVVGYASPAGYELMDSLLFALSAPRSYCRSN